MQQPPQQKELTCVARTSPLAILAKGLCTLATKNIQTLQQPVVLPISVLLHQLYPLYEIPISFLVHTETALFIIQKQMLWRVEVVGYFLTYLKPFVTIHYNVMAHCTYFCCTANNTVFL